MLALLAATQTSAEELPASVRACAGTSDPGQRLACYDREVARFPAPALAVAPNPAPHGPSANDSVGSAAVANPQPTQVSPPPTASKHASPSRAETRGFDAHVVRVDSSPNEMVLHLDNGQAWRQMELVSGPLTLKAGDTIRIERHLGSYWLSGPHVSSMRVRQE